MGEDGILIEVLVGFDDIFHRRWCLDDGGTEDATGEVTTIGDEIDVGIEVALYLFQTLTDLSDVLMLEGFVDAQVVVAPGEVGRGTRLLTCTCRSCDGIDRYILFQQVQIGSRQQCHLNTSGEAARISQMLSLGNLFFVDLRQTIDIIMITLDAEVLCQVDDFYVLWDGMLLEEGLTLAVTETEEYDVNLIKRHLVGELQICLTDESFVYVADEIASIAL